MESFLWRPKAKLVAIIDLVLILLGALFMIVFIILFASETKELGLAEPVYGTAQESHWTTENLKSYDWIVKNAYATILILIGITLVVVTLQIWADIELHQAAINGRDPSISLRRAIIWRNITIVTFILSMIGNLVGFNILGLFIVIVWRSISFYIVSKFIGELWFALNTENNRPGSAVIRK